MQLIFIDLSAVCYNKGSKVTRSSVYMYCLSLSLSQGVHESAGPSLEYYQLERLVELVVSPYLSNVLHNRNQLLLGQWWRRDSLNSLVNEENPSPDRTGDTWCHLTPQVT